MTIPKLLKFDELAKEMDVPRTKLEEASDFHGLTVEFGSTRRIALESVKELIELCRVAPKVPDSISARQRVRKTPSTSSVTASTNIRPAQLIATKLKQNSASI